MSTGVSTWRGSFAARQIIVPRQPQPLTHPGYDGLAHRAVAPAEQVLQRGTARRLRACRQVRERVLSLAAPLPFLVARRSRHRAHEGVYAFGVPGTPHQEAAELLKTSWNTSALPLDAEMYLRVFCEPEIPFHM